MKGSFIGGVTEHWQLLLIYLNIFTNTLCQTPFKALLSENQRTEIENWACKVTKQQFE